MWNFKVDWCKKKCDQEVNLVCKYLFSFVTPGLKLLIVMYQTVYLYLFYLFSINSEVRE